MNVKSVEKLEKSQVAVTVEVTAEEFEAAVQKAYLKMRNKISVPGFRPGKAPRKMIEKLYGEGVFYSDAVDAALPDAYTQAIGSSGLDVVGYPEIEIVDDQIGKDGFTFKATVAVYPEVELGQYKGVSAVKEEVKVTADDVKERLNQMAEREARLVSVDRKVKKGDTAVIDFEGFDNGVAFEGGKGENHELEIGSGSFVPGFEDQIIGMKAGEEKDIDITFPENYTPELAGKAVVFKIKLNGITTPELPELDDEFAKDVSEFDTLDEYKTSLRGDLEKRKKDEAENDFRANILKQAVNNLQAEIPECMILEKVEQTIRDYASNFGMTDRSVPLENLKEMMGLSDEVVENNIRPAAEFQVKTDLLLDKIKDEEKLEVTEEAFNEYLNKVAEDVKATADQLKNYFGEAFIKAEQLKEMATNLIVDSAKVKAAEAEEKPKKARKPKTPKADDKAEETEAAAEEPKAE